MTNTDENKELNHNQPLSILQRLDRLELLLLFLEKKQCHTIGDSSDNAIYKCLEQEQQCKSLSYVFEEVHHKGTLLERVALLENRVIQLSIDLDMGNTSRSSSSTSTVAGKLGKGSGSLDVNENMDMVTKLEEKHDTLITQDSIVVEACSLNSPSCKAHRIKAMSRMGYNRKWLKWLKFGC